MKYYSLTLILLATNLKLQELKEEYTEFGHKAITNHTDLQVALEISDLTEVKNILTKKIQYSCDCRQIQDRRHLSFISLDIVSWYRKSHYKLVD